MRTMQHIDELIEEYEATKREDLVARSILVLQMIEHSITYPPLRKITEEDLSEIDRYVKQLVKDLRKDDQYLFSVRLMKIWKKREHLCELAKLWHEVKNDYMDSLEYHEEVKWLRDERKRIIEN
jgi:hypothetical protein